jgi:hypothetical protein
MRYLGVDTIDYVRRHGPHVIFPVPAASTFPTTENGPLEKKKSK